MKVNQNDFKKISNILFDIFRFMKFGRRRNRLCYLFALKIEVHAG